MDAILQNHKFISRLFGMISYSIGHSEKQAQLAGFILGCVTHTEQNLNILRKFEKQLMLVSFNDDSLSQITCSLLYSMHPSKK